MINKQDVLKLIDDCISKIENAFTADEAEVILRMTRSKVEEMPDADCGGRTRTKKRYCSACKWYAPYEGVCVNGDSEHCADFRYLDDSCEYWEENNDKERRI